LLFQTNKNDFDIKVGFSEMLELDIERIFKSILKVYKSSLLLNKYTLKFVKC